MLKNGWTKITAHYKSSLRISLLSIENLFSEEGKKKKKHLLALTLIKCLAFKNNSADWAHIRQSIKAHKPNHQNKHLAHLSKNIIQPQWPSTYQHKAHQYSPPASMLLFLMIIDWGWRGDERGKPPAYRIPGQRGTRPCDVENHLLSPHLHSLQPHLHGTSSAELCLPAQPFPHGFPTAFDHSNTNESAIFNSLENLRTAAGFCYHFISIYWMEEKIAQFWIWDEMRGGERVQKHLWNRLFYICILYGWLYF